MAIEQDAQFVVDELAVNQHPFTIKNELYNGQATHSEVWLMCKNLGLKDRGPVYLRVLELLREKKFNLLTKV